MSFDAARAEFWDRLQLDFYTANSAFYLANRELEEVIGQQGRKVHVPILSHPNVGTYVPHSDIAFSQKNATDQFLEVDTFKYAAEDIDDTESSQTPFDLPGHSMKSIRMGLMNQAEQKFLDQISGAHFTIDDNGNPLVITSANILDVVQMAEGILGSADVLAGRPTAEKALVQGPRTVAAMRRSKADRESRLGDETLANGIVGPWMGWTVVENNNLPWSGMLKVATQPTDGDTVTIAGVKLTFKTSLGSTPGNVLIGVDAAAARTNLLSAIHGTAGAGSTYVELSDNDVFLLRRRRRLAGTVNSSDITFTGYGDIAVSETLTAAADIWSNLYQDSVFMIRGAIDFIVQMMKLKVVEKEKGFAQLVKGMIGVGAKVFKDGEMMMVRVRQDVSAWK